MLWPSRGKLPISPARRVSWGSPQAGAQKIRNLKSTPVRKVMETRECSLLQQEAHLSWDIRCATQGFLKPQSTECRISRSTYNIHRGHGSGLQATGASQATLGDTSSCHGVAKPPLLSRDLINRNLREAMQWTKPSRFKTGLLATLLSMREAVQSAHFSQSIIKKTEGNATAVATT